MRKYPKEIKQFIYDNIDGIYVRDLVEQINATFGTEYTYNQIRGYIRNNKLKSNVPTNNKKGSILFSSEMEKYLIENVDGISVAELTENLNKEFNTAYTYEQVRAYKNRHKLKNGLDAQFKKGQASHNKGKKGFYAKGSEKGWFKKGYVPTNHKPVGSERIDRDGYTIVKVSEPNIWRHKHRLIWEDHHGNIPRNSVVIFLDCDKSNLDISNLALITRSELKIMNQQGLKNECASITETGVLIARLISAKHKCKKKSLRKENDR